MNRNKYQIYWSMINNQAKENYDKEYETIYNTKALKYNLCIYNEAYILLRNDITVTTAPETHVSFTNFASFTKFITKIDRRTIDDAKD